MTRSHFIWMLTAAVLLLATAGCGGFVARRIVQAPNSYPTWLGPEVPVEIAFSSRFLTNFAGGIADVGPPPAQLRYRIVDPADYQLRVTSSNWFEGDQRHFKFNFDARFPGSTTPWTATPRGTVVLLHGWGLAQYSTAPWALRLAEEGWRCVLVDLRGHGASTGKRVHFGLTETNDLTQLLNLLEREQQLVEPVAVMGESYGAALALRWRTMEPRVGPVVAIAPYARLSTAVRNIRREYAAWLPAPILNAGIRRLPRVLSCKAADLDPLAIPDLHKVNALFIAGTGDRISPVTEVRSLWSRAAAGSRFHEVTGATHEALSYFLDELAPPVLEWLHEGYPLLTSGNAETATTAR